LPDELRVWLGWHNGQNPDLMGSFVESWLLLSAQDVAEEWKHRQTESDPVWNASWIPLLDDGQGDLVCLDPTQPDCPVREVWQGQKEAAVAAPSLTAWTAQFVQAVEAGRCHEDPERGEFHCR
jgi:cell wall assembly regulator SMI1